MDNKDDLKKLYQTLTYQLNGIIGKDSGAQTNESASETLKNAEEQSRVARENADLDLKHKAQLLKSKKRWSFFIGIVFSFTVLFCFSFVVLVGLNWLNYEKYPWAVNIVFGGFTIQIIGLARTIVRHLFPNA